MSVDTTYSPPWYLRLLSSVSSRERELADQVRLLKLEKIELEDKLYAATVENESLGVVVVQLQALVRANSALALNLERAVTGEVSKR